MNHLKIYIVSELYDIVVNIISKTFEKTLSLLDGPLTKKHMKLPDAIKR